MDGLPVILVDFLTQCGRTRGIWPPIALSIVRPLTVAELFPGVPAHFQNSQLVSKGLALMLVQFKAFAPAVEQFHTHGAVSIVSMLAKLERPTCPKHNGGSPDR